MEAKNQRTPGPWVICPPRQNAPSNAPFQIESAIGYAIADVRNFTTSTENAHNAIFIVTACNAHDELISALRRIGGIAESPEGSASAMDRSLTEIGEIVSAALAKVSA